MIKIEKIPSDIGYAANSYLIISNDEACVVDPSAPFNPEMIGDAKLKYILLTHAHFDHFLEIESWVKNSSATVIVSEKDREALADSHKNCYALFMYKNYGYYGDVQTVKDGDTLALGDEVIEIGEFPGHTPGSVIYVINTDAFVGDLAFEGGGYGRFDLPGGDVKSLVNSLKKLLSMDKEITIYPGHGNSTTIKEYSKYLQM